MKRRIQPGLVAAILTAGLLLVCAAILSSWTTPVLFLLDAAKAPILDRLPRWTAAQVSTRAVQVNTRYGSIPGTLYVPEGLPDAAVVLIHGMHKDGIAESRLGPFARALAARNFLVLTPQMEELQRYRITSVTTDKIEDSILWLCMHGGVRSGGRVGVVGISYSGGLSVVAAGRPSVRDRVSFVLSIGGHGDVLRAMQFLCTGFLPEGGGYVRPHDYGAGILLLNLIDRLVPEAQAGQTAEALRFYLQEEYDRGRQAAAQVPSPGGDLLRWVDARDLGRIGPLMLPHLEHLASDRALSPERSPAPAAAVFLLHGSDDALVPPFETEVLARYLAARTEVHWLVTPLLTHVEMRNARAGGEIWKILKFWRRLTQAAVS